MERKNSREGGSRGDVILRMIFRQFLENEKRENPQYFSFLEEDDTVILESLRRKYGKRREEGTSNSNINDQKLTLVENQQQDMAKEEKNKKARTPMRLRKVMREYLENLKQQHPQLFSSVEEEGRVNLKMMTREKDKEGADDDHFHEQVPQSKCPYLPYVAGFRFEVYDRKKRLLEKLQNAADTHEQQQSHAPHELPTVFQKKRANLEMLRREDEEDTDDDDFREQVPQSKWEHLLDVAEFELELYNRKKTLLEKQKNVVDTHEQQQCHAPHELPKVFQEKIQELKGDKVKLLMQKKLSETDLNGASFSVPLRQIAINFLTQKERSHLDRRFDMHVLVLDPSLRKREMRFKKCLMNKNNVYNFSKGWKKIVLDNHLKLHDNLQLWSFRVSSKLWLALIKLS